MIKVQGGGFGHRAARAHRTSIKEGIMKNLHQLRRLCAVAALVTMAFGGVGAGTANAGDGLQTRPFHATLESDFATIGVCEYGAPLQVLSGTGQATHLGRFEIEGVACLSHPTNLITWTAANGDVLNIEYYAVIGPIGPDGSATIELPAVSATGTGRFAEVAFGVGDVLAGTVWFAPDGTGHINASVDGTLTFNASNGSVH
jgi:hypothetical protein